jgi:hypothetical protein
MSFDEKLRASDFSQEAKPYFRRLKGRRDLRSARTSFFKPAELASDRTDLEKFT